MKNMTREHIKKRIKHYENMLKNDEYTKTDINLQNTIGALITELKSIPLPKKD